MKVLVGDLFISSMWPDRMYSCIIVHVHVLFYIYVFIVVPQQPSKTSNYEFNK